MWGGRESPISITRAISGRVYEEIIITAIRKTLTATAVVGAVLAGTAACGTAEQVSAGQQLNQAFEKLGREKSVSFELDLDTDAQTLKRLDAASDPGPGEEIPDEAAKLISGAKITVTVESTKPIAESEEKDFVGTAMKVSTPSGDLVEYRAVAGTTYIRSDVAALSRAMGAPLPSADELPPEAADLKKVLEGSWIKFSTDELGKVGQELGAKPSAAPSLDAKTQKKLLESLREAVARKVEFTTAGGGDGTEHITATAPVRTLLGELFTAIRPLAKDLPAGVEMPSEKDLKEIPDTKATADFTLKNGALTEVYVDLAKLTENAKVKKFGLSLKMSTGVKPVAPAGATQLNLEELMGGLFGAMMIPGEGVKGTGLAGESTGEDPATSTA
ncbi:hypothetical protein ACIP6P_23145 [Streptomyces sp. NPDC088729]|uniref:hypothetical protein n=1 Tax=Streptomyces sp. NPDC088729 TaxID=3365876 RepID=UPI0038126A7B